MENEEKKQDIIKWSILALVILFVLWFVSSLFIAKKEEKKTIGNYIKEEASYTLPDSNVTSYMPQILFDSSDAEKVNNEIKEAYNNVVKEGSSQFTYQYSVSDHYFSLVTILNRVDSETGFPYPSFTTYNFDLDTKSLVNDDVLYGFFGKTENDFALSFENTMKDYYQKELEELYLNKDECDYNCFLDRRNISDYHDDIHLFVDNNDLKFYRSFMVYSDIGEEEFYKDEDFLFE